MGTIFPNESYGQEILKHRELPILVCGEFDFFRCLAFDESFYKKTVSELHSGNLRQRNSSNRFSSLFSYQKVSYWADSPATARAELKYHNKTNNVITFWAYDDATSTFPTIEDREPLYIIDGRQFGFDEILWKDEKGIAFSRQDKELINKIVDERPDCLAYNSKRHLGGVNFLFFEKGFKKLSIRKVSLRLGNRLAKNTARIICANGCDYLPYLDSYGDYFDFVAKVGTNPNYINTEEYQQRNYWYDKSCKNYSAWVNEEKPNE